MTINHFLEHWRIKITDAGEICGASREAQNIKRMRGHVLLILLLLAAPGMPSNHRGRRSGAHRSEDARRQSAGVRHSFFANNSSVSPAEDILGLVPLTGGRRAVLPSMHGRSFTAPLIREALRAERQQQRQEDARALESCILLISRSIATTPTATPVYLPHFHILLPRANTDHAY